MPRDRDDEANAYGDSIEQENEMLIKDSGKLLDMLQRICDGAVNITHIGDFTGVIDTTRAELPRSLIAEARQLLVEVNARMRS